MDLLSNRIILGDCLVDLDTVPDASIDLIVTDPPYGAGFDFANDKLPLPELLAFTERWLRKAIVKIKSTGSFYCFIDGEHLGYFQTIIDKYLAFRKVVVWYFEAFFNGFHKNYDNRSEFILFYTKSDDYTFHETKEPPSVSMLKRWGPYADKDGNIPMIESRAAVTLDGPAPKAAAVLGSEVELAGNDIATKFKNAVGIYYLNAMAVSPGDSRENTIPGVITTWNEAPAKLVDLCYRYSSKASMPTKAEFYRLFSVIKAIT